MGLQWNDVDFTNKTLQVNKQKRKSGELVETKTKTSKECNINQKLADLLERYSQSFIVKIKTKDFLFSRSRSYYDTAKTRLEKKYNLPKIRMHDLRHSHATLLINNDVNIHVIAERLGHASINTTERVYAHLYDEKKKQVVDLLESLDND